jgi:hypothetical protein
LSRNTFHLAVAAVAVAAVEAPDSSLDLEPVEADYLVASAV